MPLKPEIKRPRAILVSMPYISRGNILRLEIDLTGASTRERLKAVDDVMKLADKYGFSEEDK